MYRFSTILKYVLTLMAMLQPLSAVRVESNHDRDDPFEERYGSLADLKRFQLKFPDQEREEGERLEKVRVRKIIEIYVNDFLKNNDFKSIVPDIFDEEENVRWRLPRLFSVGHALAYTGVLVYYYSRENGWFQKLGQIFSR